MRHTTRAVAAIALTAGLTLAGCGGGDSSPGAVAEPAASTASDGAADASTGGVPDHGLVTAAEAAALAAGGVTVIDVRTPEEFAEGHLEGAELIDFYDATFADRIAALDPAGEYLVYCRSGNRSSQAVAMMAELGIDQVWDLDGGVVAYSAAGLPLVR